MVEETFIWTEILKNQEALLTFLRGQDARHGSSECWPALNQIAPLIIATQLVKKKKEILHFLRPTFPKGLKGPRWRRSAGTWKFASNAMFFEYRGTFR